MKTIYTYKGPSKQDRWTEIDGETALWLMRMCVGEAGNNCQMDEASAMLWALMNRWMLHPWRKRWPTFLGMVRRFSQPINPQWLKDGSKALKYKGTAHCTPAKFRRREHIQRLRIDEIPETIKIAVFSFTNGTLNPFPIGQRYSNWASYRGIKRKFPHGIDIRGNWFFEDLDPKLIRGHVVIDHWAEEE